MVPRTLARRRSVSLLELNERVCERKVRDEVEVEVEVGQGEAGKRIGSESER